MDPRLGFTIWKFEIRYYALIIILGALVAGAIAAWRAKKNGRDPETIIDIMPWVLIGGIIGARLWHVFTPGYFDGITTQEYFKNPLLILQIWKGGLGIPGGVIGGALALFIYTKVKKESFLEWADYIAPGLLVAQGIGRWGNYINQELYGKPSNLPWAIEISPEYRYPGFENISHYHPLFFYEFVLNILAAVILLLIDRNFKKKLYKGDLFLLYLVAYPAIRFGLEFVRLVPSLSKSGVNINQTVMLIVMILAIVVFVLRHTFFKPKQSEELAEEEVYLDETVEEEQAEDLEELDSLDADLSEIPEGTEETEEPDAEETKEPEMEETGEAETEELPDETEDEPEPEGEDEEN